MNHVVYTMAVGALGFLGCIVIPLLIGLPCSLFLNKQIRAPFSFVATWFVGAATIVLAICCYVFGSLFV
jgi:ABC-type spermidine/putrescine transport system permease subunit I